MTATGAGELLGESPTTCSFHFRQLAKYGLVEEAGGGRGRERPWRATALFTSWPNIARSPEMAAAAGLLDAVVIERYFEQAMRAVEAKSNEPPEWQEATFFGDMLLYLTAQELVTLGDEVRNLAARYLERTPNSDLRPADARLVTFIELGFPL